MSRGIFQPDCPVDCLVDSPEKKNYIPLENGAERRIRLLRLVVRTPGFHPGNRGSTPLGDGGWESPAFGGSQPFFSVQNRLH